MEKNKQKAEGYADDFSILHTKLPVSVFMASDTPAVILQNAYEVIYVHHEKSFIAVILFTSYLHGDLFTDSFG